MLPGANDGRPDVTDASVMDNGALTSPGVGVLPTRPGWPRVVSLLLLSVESFHCFVQIGQCHSFL